EDRMKICLTLGFKSLSEVHDRIMQGRTRGAAWLLRQGLNADRLQRLGYAAEGMKKLGYPDAALAELGYAGYRKPETQPSPPPESDARGSAIEGAEAAELRRLIDGGARAADLARLGYQAHQIKRLGHSALDLARMGYDIADLAKICSVAELRRADFKAAELARFFSGHELKSGGFSASEMRLAGYTVRDLIQLGYNENLIRT